MKSLFDESGFSCVQRGHRHLAQSNCLPKEIKNFNFPSSAGVQLEFGWISGPEIGAEMRGKEIIFELEKLICFPSLPFVAQRAPMKRWLSSLYLHLDIWISILASPYLHLYIYIAILTSPYLHVCSVLLNKSVDGNVCVWRRKEFNFRIHISIFAPLASKLFFCSN